MEVITLFWYIGKHLQDDTASQPKTYGQLFYHRKHPESYMLHIEYVAIFIVYLYTKFCMPVSSDSLVITGIPKDNSTSMLHTVAMLFFYVLQRIK
jgi:hypothetical protein